ncbi:MAG TPA: hypothetical protein VE224_01610 [Pseudolabrys sp.]|nr:hypothetical protein [Pseudolabrys sp.]
MVRIAGGEEDIYGTLTGQFRAAPAPGPALLSRLIQSICPRVQSLTAGGKAGALNRAVEASAWTETALLLVELELPFWRLRRLVNESGEWLCSLSINPSLPIEYDDTADGHHEHLPMAILLSLIDAKAKSARRTVVEHVSVPQIKPRPIYSFCCDNFG